MIYEIQNGNLTPTTKYFISEVELAGGIMERHNKPLDAIVFVFRKGKDKPDVFLEGEEILVKKDSVVLYRLQDDSEEFLRKIKILQDALETEEGRIALTNAMAEPIKRAH